uniref:Uncharacterized protein n=1 Tax=Macaca fascicularis TaxID=9541 RepID=A0A7N9DE98_MACFA
QWQEKNEEIGRRDERPICSLAAAGPPFTGIIHQCWRQGYHPRFAEILRTSPVVTPVTCWCWEAPRCNQKHTDPAARRPDPQTCASQDRLHCAPCTCHQPLASRYTQHPGLVPLPHHDRQSVPQGPRVVQTDAAARMVELHAKNDTAVKTTMMIRPRSDEEPSVTGAGKRRWTQPGLRGHRHGSHACGFGAGPHQPVWDRARVSARRGRQNLPAGSTMAK